MNAPDSIFTASERLASERGTALVVESSEHGCSDLEQGLCRLGYSVRTDADHRSAIDWYTENHCDIAFVVASSDAGPIERTISTLKKLSSDRFVPLVVVYSNETESSLESYMSAGADDYLSYPFTATSLQRRIGVLEQLSELQKLYQYSLNEQVVGKRIQAAALSSRTTEVESIQSLNRSAAIFSGDLMLVAHKPDGGLHVLLADFTGHGLSAAIAVLPVADTFSVMTEKGFEPDLIIRQINNKLYKLLPTNMFMAATIVKVDNDLSRASVWNAGMPDVYLQDGDSGCITKTFGSACLPLGVVGNIESNLNKVDVDVKAGDQFIMHSDGLTECVDQEGEMYGVDRLESIINTTSVDEVYAAIVADLDEFSGGHDHDDDISLVCIPCVEQLFLKDEPVCFDAEHVNHERSGNWRLVMELSGASLYDVDPVPVLINEYSKQFSQPVPVMQLHKVLSELYKNSLEYGVFDSQRKDKVRAYRCSKSDKAGMNLFDGSYIKIELKQVSYMNRPAVYLRVEDSGKGFDHSKVMLSLKSGNEDLATGYGLNMVRAMCNSIRFNDAGNSVEAVLITPVLEETADV